MNKVGNALLARLKLMRDFEESERVGLFLKRRGLRLDVEPLAPGLLRLQSDVEKQIDTAFVKAFEECSPGLNEQRKEGEESFNPHDLAERKILSFVEQELKKVRGTKDVSIKVGFREEPGKDLKVGVVLESKGLYSYFVLPVTNVKVGEEDIQKIIERYPVLAWVLDDESPLFIVEASEALKRAIIFEKLFSENLNDISVNAIKTQARRFLDVSERSFNEVEKHFNKAIKKVEKALSEFITVEGYQIAVEKSALDEKDVRVSRAVFKVSGLKPLWLVLDVHFEKNWEHGLFLKEFVFSSDRNAEESLTNDLFELSRGPEFEIDPSLFKWILNRFAYRNSDARSEKIYALLAKNFEKFSFTKERDDFRVNIKSSVEINTDRSFEQHRAAVLTSVHRLMSFCQEKKINISGRIEFFSSSENEILYIIEFKKGLEKNMELRMTLAKPDLQVSTLDVGISKNTNLKHIPHLSSLLSLTVDPFDQGKKSK